MHARHEIGDRYDEGPLIHAKEGRKTIKNERKKGKIKEAKDNGMMVQPAEG